MNPKKSHKLEAILDILPFAAPPGVLSWVACAGCSEPLSLHQPDTKSPVRLLGVCEACTRWFLIEMMPEQGEAMMILLPTGEMLRAATDAQVSGYSSIKPQS